MRAQSYNRSIRLQSLPLHVTDRVCTMTRYTPRAERARTAFVRPFACPFVAFPLRIANDGRFHFQ